MWPEFVYLRGPREKLPILEKLFWVAFFSHTPNIHADSLCRKSTYGIEEEYDGKIILVKGRPHVTLAISLKSTWVVGDTVNSVTFNDATVTLQMPQMFWSRRCVVKVYAILNPSQPPSH